MQTASLNPLQQLKSRWQQAMDEQEPGAAYCSLATLNEQGYPSVRVLTLREISAQGVLLFTNATGPKWRELQRDNRFEIHIFWPRPMIQYKLTGNQFSPLDPSTMASHWQKKPYEAKILDLFYSRIQPQSTTTPSRQHFLAQLEALKQEHPEPATLPYPDHALGLWFEIHTVEAWLGSPEDRQHQRYSYQLTTTGWHQQVLVP